MIFEDFQTAQHAVPFIPYNIHLPDGRKLKVVHPDFVAISPIGRSAVVFDPDGRYHYIDFRLVSDLSFDPRTPAEKRRRSKR
jgi:hypothetical protein